MRERIASQRGVADEAICTDNELKAIAQDRPMHLKDLVPGKHGSSLFLTQHAAEIVSAVATKGLLVAVSAKSDSEFSNVIGMINHRTTLDGLAEQAHMKKAALVELLQRAIESGSLIERGALVDDNLYSGVSDYMRYHRYAKLRDVRDHLGGEPSLPELRLAVAFAR